MDNDEIEWKDCWKKPVKVQYKEITETAEIETREGKLYGYAGKDVLLKGIKGEVYPCKIDIFNATYTTTAPLSEEAIRAEGYKKGQRDAVDMIFTELQPLLDYINVKSQSEVLVKNLIDKIDARISENFKMIDAHKSEK